MFVTSTKITSIQLAVETQENENYHILLYFRSCLFSFNFNLQKKTFH